MKAYTHNHVHRNVHTNKYAYRHIAKCKYNAFLWHTATWILVTMRTLSRRRDCTPKNKMQTKPTQLAERSTEGHLVLTNILPHGLLEPYLKENPNRWAFWCHLAYFSLWFRLKNSVLEFTTSARLNLPKELNMRWTWPLSFEAVHLQQNDMRRRRWCRSLSHTREAEEFHAWGARNGGI
jgi:hypothetical protein